MTPRGRPAVALVQRVALIDFPGLGQAIECLPHFGVRDRDLRLVVHEAPIALGEAAFDRLRSGRDEPLDFGTNRRRIVVGRAGGRLEEHVEIDDQLGERAKPGEACITHEQLQPLTRRNDRSALLLEFAARTSPATTSTSYLPFGTAMSRFLSSGP